MLLTDRIFEIILNLSFKGGQTNKQTNSIFVNMDTQANSYNIYSFVLNTFYYNFIYAYVLRLQTNKESKQTLSVMIYLNSQ